MNNIAVKASLMPSSTLPKSKRIDVRASAAVKKLLQHDRGPLLAPPRAAWAAAKQRAEAS